jgi:hypothetical protein
MVDALLYLAPGLLSQILIAGFLLWLFVNKRDDVGTLRIVAASLGFTALNLLIEWFLNDYLLIATLVLQWAVFALIANRFLSMPLARACITLFCFFSLMMSLSMLEAHFNGTEMTEDEKLLLEGFERPDGGSQSPAPDEDWVQRIEAGLISQKTYAAKKQLQAMMYKTPEADSVALLPAPQSTPTPLPGPAPLVPAQTTVSKMTGAEFEKLFFQEDPPAEITQVPPTPDPTPDVFVSDLSPGFSNASINAQQMSNIVNIRSRSTDPGYSPPEFLISAVSMGSQGQFAIVNGKMLRQGNVVPSESSPPRAWRLYRIQKNEVYWQPLK